MSDALIVFAKVPMPGRVKTRLTTLLTPLEAARLYAAFLRDALVQYRTLEADVRLYLAPPEQPLPADMAPGGVSVHWQAGEGLGARMERALMETFAAGVHRAVVIGTDHPSLPTSFVQRAFEALDAPRSVCLGPSNDGGYYLLGLSDVLPALFEMTYSHDGVFEETLAQASREGARITVLPPWYDVDTPDDLQRLIGDLEDPSITAPHTRSVLQALQPFEAPKSSSD